MKGEKLYLLRPLRTIFFCFLKKEPTFSFSTGPHKLCSWLWFYGLKIKQVLIKLTLIQAFFRCDLFRPCHSPLLGLLIQQKLPAPLVKQIKPLPNIALNGQEDGYKIMWQGLIQSHRVCQGQGPKLTLIQPSDSMPWPASIHLHCEHLSLEHHLKIPTKSYITTF